MEINSKKTAMRKPVLSRNLRDLPVVRKEGTRTVLPSGTKILSVSQDADDEPRANVEVQDDAGVTRGSIALGELGSSVDVDVSAHTLVDGTAKASIITALGMEINSRVDFEASVNLETLIEAAASAQFKAHNYSAAQLQAIFNSSGDVSGPGITGSVTSLSLSAFNAVGFIFDVRSNSTQEGNASIVVNICDNTGAIQGSYSLSLKDVNKGGKVFVAKTGLASALSQTLQAAAPAAFGGGAFPDNSVISENLTFSPKANDYELILRDQDGQNSGAYVNSIVLQGQNANVRIYSVRPSSSVQKAALMLAQAGQFNSFGNWALSNFIKASAIQ